jgi:hypothetical protein
LDEQRRMDEEKATKRPALTPFVHQLFLPSSEAHNARKPWLKGRSFAVHILT